MSTSGRDTLTPQAFADLDAAPAAPLTAEQERRADETLAGVLATAPPDDRALVRRRRARPVPRAFLLVAAAAALALVVSVTGVLGGDTAYGSWTTRPIALADAAQEELAQQCRDYLAVGATGQSGTPTADDLQAARLVLADTRGAWSYVVLSGADSLEATCLVEEARGLSRLLPGKRSAAGSYGFISVPVPGARAIIGSGLMAMSADEGSAWSTEGHVGEDVTDVMILTESGTEIEATLINGRFAAWWPDRESIDEMGGLAQIHYVVTLADGTVLAPQTYDEIAPGPANE